jgi:hypothetical protein
VRILDAFAAYVALTRLSAVFTAACFDHVENGGIEKGSWMSTLLKMLFVATVAGALLIGVGAAIAGNGDGRAKGARCDRVLERIAAKRGVSVDELRAMRKERVLERVATALAAGTITEAKAAEIRARVESGTAGCAKLLRRARLLRARGLVLSVSAVYLGTTVESLKDELQAGQSLAQVAAAKGKSVEGLEDALSDAFAERLERVTRLTDEQRAKVLERFEARLDQIVNRIPKQKAA